MPHGYSQVVFPNCSGNTFIAFASKMVHKYLFLNNILSFIGELLDLKEKSNNSLEIHLLRFTTSMNIAQLTICDSL